MGTHTADELEKWADLLKAQARDPARVDDPRWLSRWAKKLRAVADGKLKSLAHKRSSAKRRRAGA